VIERLLQGCDGELGWHRRKAAPTELIFGCAISHAFAGPKTPSDRSGWPPQRLTLLSQCVQESIGGRIRALVPTSPDARDRGEEDERVEGTTAKQVIEVVSTKGLAGCDISELSQSHLRQRGLLGDARSVDDSMEGISPSFQALEQRCESLSVSRVAGSNGDAGTEGGELGTELVRSRSARSTAAGQDEVLGAALGKPSGDVSP
jgi:hypothetical protein